MQICYSMKLSSGWGGERTLQSRPPSHCCRLRTAFASLQIDFSRIESSAFITEWTRKRAEDTRQCRKSAWKTKQNANWPSGFVLCMRLMFECLKALLSKFSCIFNEAPRRAEFMSCEKYLKVIRRLRRSDLYDVVLPKLLMNCSKLRTKLCSAKNQHNKSTLNEARVEPKRPKLRLCLPLIDFSYVSDGEHLDVEWFWLRSSTST